MPMNLEYVLISYGLWVLAFVIYIPWIKQKRKVFQQSLKTLKETQCFLADFWRQQGGCLEVLLWA